MKETYSPAILASYVTFKELYNEGKYRSPYQILGEFIKFIVVTEHNYSFSLFDMKNHLKRVFGFELPTAVIKTSIKGISGINKMPNSADYVVNEKQIAENEGFSEFRKEAEKDNSKLSEMLIAFAKQRNSEEYIAKEVLIQDFIAYLIDEHSDTKHHDLISEFILFYAENQDVMRGIESIRQGAVLYTGLNYNISETGSLRKNLVLYLDTEILFNLAGYNGEVYKSIAKDFIGLVNDANSGEKKIKLYYFKEVHDEIDRFFSTAEAIVEGKQLQNNKPAMKAICNGCESRSDVIEKQADLFHTLKMQYGINEDPNSTYYSQSLNSYNLEGMKFENIPDDVDTEDALRYISHINKLRKGQQFKEYTEAEYLLITETRRALDISKAATDQLTSESERDSIRMCGFAQNMSGITNILWYKLNKGFGRKDYPQNLDAVLKAKIVIAKHVSQKAAIAYRDLKEKYDKGEISNEIMATRMMALREKNEKPEEIDIETAENDLDFSPEYYHQYEATIESNKTLLKEQKDYIAKLEEQAEFERQRADTKIARLEGTIEEQKNTQSSLIEKLNAQQYEMDAQNLRISELNQIIQNQELHKRLIINWFKLIGRSVFKVVMLGLLSLGVRWICVYYKWDFGTVFSNLIGIVGIVPTGYDIIAKDYKRLIKDTIDEGRCANGK